MNKKILSTIPRPVLTGKNKEMLLLAPSMSYLVTASRQDVGGIDTLIINFFRAEKKELSPAFRTFCQEDDYITQDLTTDKTKWKTGAINYLTGYLYWNKNKGNIVIASVEERKLIFDFLYGFKKKHNIDNYQRYISHGSVVDTELQDRIDEYQNTIKRWRLQKKHDKEKSEIDSHMSKFGDIPADYESFVKDTVFVNDNYIFYSRPKRRAYCTKCGHDFELEKDGKLKKNSEWNISNEFKHNRTARCPHCNKSLTCKSEGMSRGQLFLIRWSVLVQKHKEEVLVRYFVHTKDLRDDFRNPKIESGERYRTVHTADKVRAFEWAAFKSTQEVRWCVTIDRSYGFFPPAEIIVPRSAILYNKNLLDDVSGTCMKYSAVDIYVDKMIKSNFLDKPWYIDWYFNSYRKHPYLEQLLKIGFYNIAHSVLKDHMCLEFKNGRTILETLGINKLQFNMLRSVGDPSIRDLMILRYARSISQQDFDIVRYVSDNGNFKTYEKYLDMRQYTTVYKVKKYIDKQGITHDTDYFDYIRWLQEMGYDMRNDFNLYPKNFVKAHDNKSKEYIAFKDKKAKEDIKRFNRLLKKLRKNTADMDAMNLRVEGMFIRIPDKLEDLKREGEVLHHCVGTYIDKVAKGETMIFFIRRESEPDKPFYTLEWKGRMVQCRGFRNSDMTPEVKAFSEIFQEKMIEFASLPLSA